MTQGLNVCALDLGTLTGFCVGTPSAHRSGTWDLSEGHFDRGMRGFQLRRKLTEAFDQHGFELIVYEAVQRHKGTYAGHTYGELAAAVAEFSNLNDVPIKGVGVGVIKKAFTGKGNATKLDMINEAEDRGYLPGDDNEADAIAIFCCAEEFIDV